MDKYDLSYLQVEPTTRCNYTCGFCLGRHMEQKNIAVETLKEVVDAVQNLKHVSIQGEGEPLLHPNFFEMVRYIRSKHPNTRVSLISNGSLFTNENIDNILSLGINCIMVSIESPKEEDFREIRGGKLSKVVAGIRSLLEERNKRQLIKPRVGFAVTVLRRTMLDYKGIISLYHELGMDGGMTCQFLQNMKGYTDIYDPAMKEQILGDEDIQWLSQEVAENPSVVELLNTVTDQPNFYRDLLASPSPGCPWLSNGLYVNMNGMATGCCYIKDAVNEGFGKLNTSNVGAIFAQREEFQMQLLRGQIPKGCDGCALANRIQHQVLSAIAD